MALENVKKSSNGDLIKKLLILKKTTDSFIFCRSENFSVGGDAQGFYPVSISSQTDKD